MPSRNTVRQDQAESFYHLYSRGANKLPIFLDSDDYTVFLGLLKRYLSVKPAKMENRVEYPHYYGEIEVLAYCLMPNHFHLLVFQSQEAAVQKLMKSILTSYTMYMNKKYKRSGHLFENRYRASMITDDIYLMHISRYIHLNPEDWRAYPYSSLSYYLGFSRADWVMPSRILELFNSPDAYWDFLADYESYKSSLKNIHQELAHS